MKWMIIWLCVSWKTIIIFSSIFSIGMSHAIQLTHKVPSLHLKCKMIWWQKYLSHTIRFLCYKFNRHWEAFSVNANDRFTRFEFKIFTPVIFWKPRKPCVHNNFVWRIHTNCLKSEMFKSSYVNIQMVGKI